MLKKEKRKAVSINPNVLLLYGAPKVDYERYEGGIPGFDESSGGSEIEILDSELDSFGG